MKTLKHSGDLGDVVYAMSVAKAIGQGRFMLSRNSATREPMDQSKAELLLPLLNSQKYCKGSEFRLNAEVDYDLDVFRDSMARGLTYGKPLTCYHLDVLFIPYSAVDDPWITGIKPNRIPGKKVIINRTERYQNPLFPWKTVIDEWGKQALFVGTQKEHSKFVESYGNVDYFPTENLLDVAGLIAGAEWFIGNQSCCYAVAEGMKANVIQETWLQNPDCIFRRKNAIQVGGSHLVLPELH